MTASILLSDHTGISSNIPVNVTPKGVNEYSTLGGTLWLKIHKKKIIANDNHVWVYGTYSGTHKNNWLGIPATQKDYSFDAVDIFRIEDRKLAEHWDVLNIYSLFNQLGVIK